MKVGRDIARDAYLQWAEDEEESGRIPMVADCQTAARDAVLEALRSGEIDRTAAEQEWAKELATNTHQRIASSGKEVVVKVSRGQLPLASLLDGVLIPIGEGAIRSFHNIDVLSLDMADDLRYENLRDAQETYNDWRRGIRDRIRPVLHQHQVTFGEAVARGLLE